MNDNDKYTFGDLTVIFDSHKRRDGKVVRGGLGFSVHWDNGQLFFNRKGAVELGKLIKEYYPKGYERPKLRRKKKPGRAIPVSQIPQEKSPKS